MQPKRIVFSDKILIFLFFISFFYYNLNLRIINSGDTFPSAVIPIKILTKGNLYMDEFYDYCTENKIDSYFFKKKESHYISNYPVATGLISLPFYVAPVFLFSNIMGNHMLKKTVSTEEWVRFAIVIEKFSASFITSLSVLVFFLIVRKLSNDDINVSLLLTFVYAFCSSASSVSSQALWQHTTGIFFMLLSVFLLMRLDNVINIKKEISGKRINLAIILLGIICGICICIRLSNLLFVLPLSIYFLLRFPLTKTIIFALSAMPLGFLLIFYNLYYFNSLTGGYEMTFTTNFIDGFSGLLFSPGRGLFFYFPFAIFGFAGSYLVVKNKKSGYDNIYIIFIVFAILQLLLISKWFSWWGGHCYGPRLLSEIQPFLILSSVPVMQTFVKRYKIIKIIIILFIIYSFFAQGVGTFFHPAGGWDTIPVNINDSPERLWNFNDNPLKRNIIYFISYFS